LKSLSVILLIPPFHLQLLPVPSFSSVDGFLISLKHGGRDAWLLAVCAAFREQRASFALLVFAETLLLSEMSDTRSWDPSFPPSSGSPFAS